MSEKRKYQKRSDYWSKFQKAESSSLELFSKPTDFSPELIGESYYESNASCGTKIGTEYRKNSVSKNPTKDRFKNIYDGVLPYDYSADFVDVHDAIELCQKAYFNIPAFRSTVDLLSEFADSDIYLEGGNGKSRAFIEAWFRRIKIHDVKAQYFREYYRSGNVFFYTLESKIKNSAESLIESYGAVNTRSEIPIKYVLLNPVDIGAKGAISFGDFEYVKILTPFEVARLKNPNNQYEKELRTSLPKDVLEGIDRGARNTSDKIYLKIDSKSLNPIFAKKQDYEPLSIPALFAVLDDMNKKIELKKIDQAIARSIENVVLLVTMGAEPDKGGINDKNIRAMQEIFKNQSVGRVLVSDYTTKAEFVIPDLKKVMGKEKYEILNKDIEEGLQNILIGESKYADTKLKLKIFMNRLEESRNLFLKEFLQPEIKRICKSLGMRSFPTVKFVKTDTLDDSDLQKLVTRMMELGLLTPEQGLKTIRTGIFPNETDLVPAQKDYLENRKEGYYMPLVNSINLHKEDDEAKQQNFENKMVVEQKKTTSDLAKNTITPSPVGTPKTATSSPSSGGRPLGKSNATFSKKSILSTTKEINEFELKTFAAFSEKYGVEKMEKDKELISRVSESIIVAKEKEEWDETLSKIVEDFDHLSELNISTEVLDVGAKHQLDDLAAAILYHSTKNSV
jgi:hypothetical protein